MLDLTVHHAHVSCLLIGFACGVLTMLVPWHFATAELRRRQDRIIQERGKG